jgi:hypothetical protein
MSDKECLHCQLLALVQKWAKENGAKEANKITHAGGVHIFGSMVEVAMDILAITPPAERRELYGFLFQLVMNGGLESGLIQTVGEKTTKHTIN